jgi:formiminotetrahydrofolate cyclodeaminase
MESPGYIDEPLRSFLAKLGDGTPEPAGGAALALAAACAASLVSLTCGAGLSGAAPADDVDAGRETLVSCLESTRILAARTRLQVDADVDAYRKVSRCLRPPVSSADEGAQRAAVDQALRGAIEVPLEVAESGLEIIDLAVRVAPAVRSPALGDLAAAVHLAEAAVKGSLGNTRLNARALSDKAYADEARRRAGAIALRLADLAEQAHAAFAAQGLPT